MKTFTSMFLFICMISKTYANELKSGFVYLSDIAPSILVDLKYNQNENITGKPLKGCVGRRAILSQEAAEALSNVQEELINYGYSLLVYNAYYPKKSYDELQKWLEIDDSKETKNLYYPNLTKAEIRAEEYMQLKYHHVRGSTVDVTIISLKDKISDITQKQQRSYKNQKDITYVYDGSIDMGTSYDIFDPLSNSNNTNIPHAAQDNRKLLRRVMQNHGFMSHDKFWWQFTLVREPYIDSEFDFDA